jgi:valyl-tRNA synthetase
MNLDPRKIGAYKKFANKIWNMNRFLLENHVFEVSKPITIAEIDSQALTELATVRADVTRYLDTFQFHLAAETLYHYMWHMYADVYIEARKQALMDGGSDRDSHAHTLATIMRECLTMLHPFMPFITETIWQRIPHTQRQPLITTHWPL